MTPNRKVFHDSVQELPQQTGVTSAGLNVNAANADHEDQIMPVTFSLAIPEAMRQELEEKVARGERVSPAELNLKYAVDPDEVNPLVEWLKKQGYEITRISADRTSVYAQATVAQIEKSLNVQMVRVTKDGLTYTAARNAPSLPADIAASVHAIGGLQPFRHAHKHFRHGPRQYAVAAASSAGKPPYRVADVLKAYSAANLSVTGKGQTIAILIDAFPLESDLELFWKENGIGVSLNQIEMINVGGGVLPQAEGEETLDASWTSGIARGAAIRIYAAGSLQFTALDLALDAIINDLATQTGMNQLSISLGLGETYIQPGEVRTQHQKFLRLAAAGVNVFVSSGDAGSNPDLTGHSMDGPLQAEYSSSDPCVVGVGGTSLVLSADGSVRSETGWSGGGGGKSRYFKRPVWQKGSGVPSGDQRLVPDVSLTADPNEGVFLIFNGQQFPGALGGTSWSAPVWAGFCALINEARANAGKGPLPFLNTVIYPLLGTACFRDIVSGNNGAYDAATGYDLVTGIGVPVMDALIGQLTSTDNSNLITPAMNQSIVKLMSVPPAQHDLGWLQEALQAAVLLELSTIPPYLCGLWSIKSGDGPVYELVQGVVFEEMLHMGLVCNMLTAIGGSPQIVSGYRSYVKYPGSLPGGVRPELVVYLAGLSKEYVQNVYMGIETPEQGDIVHLAATTEQYPTIGNFYNAILVAFVANNPPLRSDRQLASNIRGNPLFKIATIDDVNRAIEEITEQGEGTSQTPFAADFGGELAHYYRFKEIVQGKTVVQAPGGGFTFGDPSIPFPEVFPMRPVPEGGYVNPSPAVVAALRDFDNMFATVLTKLENAWATGSQADLKAAVGAMVSLEPLVGPLLNTQLPDGSGVYGPDFRLP